MTARAELEQTLRYSIRFHLQFDVQESLASVLRGLTAYGGGTDLRFPELANFPPPVNDLISTFVSAWETRGDDRHRVALAMQLWAKSERLTFERILEAAGVETASS
jgi:hypothetical protein